MADPNNKFPVSQSSWGDPDPSFSAAEAADNAEDFAQDSTGIPNVDQHEKTDMAMTYEPNKFPRQTGHDSLSEEEAYLS